MRDEIFRVQEIHCASCENAMRSSLGGLEGVSSVAPDQTTDSVRVSYDEHRLEAYQIAGRLADAGFPPADHGEAP